MDVPSVNLQCVTCAKRKIRCDKQQPCSACVKAGKVCTPVVRPRLPRGRRGGRSEGTIDISSRISRLERLILSAQNASGTVAQSTHDPTTTSVTEPPAPRLDHPENSQHPAGLEDLSQCPRYRNDIGRTLGSTVWTQLSTELNGLRSAIEDYDVGEQVNASSTTDTQPTEMLIGLSHDGDVLLDTLRDDEMSKIMDHYALNVDPVLKILHLPTFRSSLSLRTHYLGKHAESKSFKALESAVVYITVTSMTESECLKSVGQQKSAVLRIRQEHTEKSIREANLCENHDIVGLQALILYMGAIRTYNTGPRAWTLMGIAVRVAQSLKLHREEACSSLTFFQAQIARRTWYVLLAQDFRASFDRGSDPVIASDSFDTLYPLNLNDAEFDGTTIGKVVTQQDNSAFSEVTFLNLVSETQQLTRDVCFVTPRDVRESPSPIQYSWIIRDQAVESLEKHLTQQYFQYIDPSVPLQYATLCYAKALLSCMRLYVVRPLQRHPATDSLPIGNENVLLRAIEATEHILSIQTDTTRSWHWFFRGFVSWHPLAVLLVELGARQTGGASFERAWQSAEVLYDLEASKVADGVSGPLWRPLRKLMATAQQTRQLIEETRRSLQAQINARIQTLTPAHYQHEMLEPEHIFTDFSNTHSQHVPESQQGPYWPSIAGPASNRPSSPRYDTLMAELALSTGMDVVPWNNWQEFIDEVTQVNP
ncbi:hypothetical protein D6D06_08326 [Aureobasidium pullulans]|nr:hypothetical protein D6D06_08326 [Aureobasidium pullulans]